MNQKKAAPEGKRRSERSHQAIIDATVKLLGSSGYVDFSIEKVASEAGVGKQTIYRWWPSRAELVLEVWRDRLLPPLVPYNAKTPLAQYLERSLYAFGKTIGRTECRQAAICILAEAHRDPQLYKRIDEVVYAPRIQRIADAFHQAKLDQHLKTKLDIDLMIDALYGAVWYKVLIRFEKVSQTYIRKLVAQTLGSVF